MSTSTHLGVPVSDLWLLWRTSIDQCQAIEVPCVCANTSAHQQPLSACALCVNEYGLYRITDGMLHKIRISEGVVFQP